MTWMYLPPEAVRAVTGMSCAGSPCAPGPEGSTSDCGWPPPDIEPWVGSNGTFSRRPSSWRGWRTRPWIRRLSGMMLQPSMAEAGVAWWISSLRECPASHIASPDDGPAPMIPATSGPTSPTSSGNASHPSPCSRTSRTFSASDLPISPETWSAWVTDLRRGCSRRLKSAHPIAASGCSCWRTAREPTFWPIPADCSCRWPTPRAGEGAKWSAGKQRSQSLQLRSRQWATPTARDHRSIHAGPETLARNSRPLSEQVGSLPFPQAPGTRTDGDGSSSVSRTLSPRFVEALMGWPSAWTSFDCAATEWCRWWLRMRCALSRLN